MTTCKDNVPVIPSIYQTVIWPVYCTLYIPGHAQVGPSGQLPSLMWRTDGTTATKTINVGPVWGVTDVTQCDTVRRCVTSVTSVTFVQFLHNQGAESPSTPMTWTSWKPGTRCCPGDLSPCIRCIDPGGQGHASSSYCMYTLLWLCTLSAVHCLYSALCMMSTALHCSTFELE